MSALLSTAAEAITERIRALAERPAGLTVADVLDRRMAVYSGRDVALAQRLSVWKALIGHYALEAVDADLIHAARAELAKMPALNFKGLDADGRRIFKGKPARMKSAATVNRYQAAISGVFSWAIAERLTPRKWTNPCIGIRGLEEPKGRVRFLDAEERVQLFKACKASRYPRLYALVLMAMLTGARRGELLGLTWADVDLELQTARLGRTKNGDRRTLVLLPQVVEALRPFVGEPARYVFGSMRSRHKRPAVIGTAWKAAIARADVENFRFHDLRHTCASYLAQAGYDLNVIAEVLGHRRLDMTRRYAHLTVQTKADAMRDALGAIT